MVTYKSKIAKDTRTERNLLYIVESPSMYDSPKISLLNEESQLLPSFECKAVTNRQPERKDQLDASSEQQRTRTL
jgi:hypothetical protein